MSSNLIEIHKKYLQSRLDSILSDIEKATVKGHTSFVFYMPAGTIVKKPAKFYRRSTWGKFEAAGWGLEVERLLKSAGLETIVPTRNLEYDDEMIVASIPGTEWTKSGPAACEFFLNEPTAESD